MHIINLATQAVISTRSKSKFYSGDPEEDIICEDQGELEHDEIGIVRAICMKVCDTLLRRFQLALTRTYGLGAIFCDTKAAIPQHSKGP